MDIQKLLDNAVQAQRAKEMLTSEQIMLGELIIKLENINDKTLPIIFDDKKYKPSGLSSWRGVYRELAICYEGSDCCYNQPKDTCEKDKFGDHHYKCSCGGLKYHNTKLPNSPTVQDFLNILILANGRVFCGYKGGDFTMGKNTPVWVANDGECSGFKTNKDYDNQAVININQQDDYVEIITKLMSS